MEKENKYYNIIVNIVKSNKKYQGLENILDEIVDDVYSHSEVIFNTVNNESVIMSYLEKVVSTSLITVPKKLGISTSLLYSGVNSAKDVDKTLIDKMINGTTKVSNSTNTPKETFINSMDNEPIKNNIIDFKNIVIEEDNVEKLEELELEDISPKISSYSIDNVEETSLETDVSNDTLDLVDVDETNTENGSFENVVDDVVETSLDPEDNNDSLDLVDVDETDTENSSFENVIDDVVETSLDSEGNNDSLDLVDVDETNTENGSFENVVDNVVDASLNTEGNNNSLDLVDVDEINTENDLFESNDSFDLELSVDNTNKLEDLTDFGGIDAEEISLADDIEDTILFNNPEEENLDILEPTNNELIELTNTDTVDLSKESGTGTFIPTNYSVFNFEPDTKDLFSEIDRDSITKNLLDLANANPEVDIMKIYNMKYKDNETIQKIAIELKIGEDKIIEALKEIISVL